MKQESLFFKYLIKSLCRVTLLFVFYSVSYASPTIDPAWTIKKQRSIIYDISENKEAVSIYAKIVKRLKYNGLPYEYVRETLDDPRIVLKEKIIKKWEKPAEKVLDYSNYRKIFVNEKRIKAGKQFYKEHKELLQEVSRKYEVDPYLILSLIGVETFYGHFSHSTEVFNALHTIIHQMPKKSKWVEDEMVAWIMFCYAENIDPFSIKGSYAGAFGYGQFIPTSYKRYAQDVNGDGVKDPFEWADTFGSIANYLLKRGKYKANSSDFSYKSRNWTAVYKYNPSKQYVKAVLELRLELKKAINHS